MKLTVVFIFFITSLVQCFAQQILPYDSMLTRRFDRFYGDAFPLLNLEKEDSTIYNTTRLAGKTVYVDCWFTTCPPCTKEIPYSLALQQYFAADTNIIFLNICIENIERKQAWRDMIKARGLKGINVFYARNQPQTVNLLRRLGVDDFPTYLLVQNGKIIGYKAPAPSQKGFVQWAIYQASRNVKLSDAYTSMAKKSKASNDYLIAHWLQIEALTPKQ